MIKIAIAVNGGHVSRALDFYNEEGKYFIIGGTKPWTKLVGGVETTDDTTPTPPTENDFKLNDVVALKRIDSIHMLAETTEQTGDDIISSRGKYYKKVVPIVTTTVGGSGVTAGATAVTVKSLEGLKVGSKVRIASIYEGTITSISGLILTLDTTAPQEIPAGSEVLGGAFVEGAKYVYVDCYLNYDEIPLVTYRQIGLCTRVTPNTEDILKSANYTVDLINEYTSLGTLEVLDNRKPIARNIDQREHLSIIIEF